MVYLGDKPILLVKIEDANDMHVVNDVLKAYEFFRSKNVDIDLVILNEEKGMYEQYVKYEIENAILNKQLAYLRNKGIYIINAHEAETEELRLLDFRSNLILDASHGRIETQLEDLEESYLIGLSNIGEDVIAENVNVVAFGEAQDSITEENSYSEDMSTLKYYNEHGGFSEDGLEYHIKLNKNTKLPTVWSTILANENFGTVVTQNLGGFTWKENCRLNRMSSWNNNPLMDIPSEIVYLKDVETRRVMEFVRKY